METANANTVNAATIFGPGLGDTQLRVLMALKRLGPTTQARVQRDVPLATATVRGHLKSLISRGLVIRHGTDRTKRGRPEVVYALTSLAEGLFPHHEALVLQEMVACLEGNGQGPLLEQFLAERVAVRRPAALARVRGRSGLARVHAVAELLSEAGFLAQVSGTADQPLLRLCHCPIRDLVQVTKAPCRFEEAMIAELLDRSLERVEYIPDGQPACSYRVGAPSTAKESV